MNIDKYCGVIDMRLLMDPVTIAGEPSNYELETLRRYMSTSHISPTTRKEISEKDLSRSDNLRHEIQRIVANGVAGAQDLEIQEARQFNLTCINVEYETYCRTLLSGRCPSANTLMYLYCLLKDSMHLVSNCREYTDGYITVLKSDLNKLRAYQDEGGYYHLTSKWKPTLKIWGCICGFQRKRRNPWVKKLLFLNSCWHLVTFSMPSRSKEIHVVNSVRPNRVEWITGARDKVDIWIYGKRMEVTTKFAKYESEMTYMFELECIHSSSVVK